MGKWDTMERPKKRPEGKDGARASPLLSPAMCRPRTTQCSWQRCRSERPWRARGGPLIVHLARDRTSGGPSIDQRSSGGHRRAQERRPSGKPRVILIPTITEEQAMDYRTILLDLTADELVEARLDVARSLASRFGAALIGMHVS